MEEEQLGKTENKNSGLISPYAIQRFVDVPLPPSNNALYGVNRHTGRRYKLKPYKEWIKTASGVCIHQKTMDWPVQPCYKLTWGVVCSYRRDVSNMDKALLDLFKHIGAITDDRYMDEGTYFRMYLPEPREDGYIEFVNISGHWPKTERRITCQK